MSKQRSRGQMLRESEGVPMRSHRVVPILAACSAALALGVVPPASSLGAPAPSSGAGAAQRALLYSSDGMRPDLMTKYAAAGAMPAYAAMMRAGVIGANGMTQAFPPNTGVGWYTMATGTYPGEHGSTNNTFHRVGEASFNNRTSFSGQGVLQADTIAAAAERAGKKVAQVDWVGGRSATDVTGPTVDFANFFSRRGVLAFPLDAGEQGRAQGFGLSYQVAAFTAASGWTHVPTSDPATPPRQGTL